MSRRVRIQDLIAVLAVDLQSRPGAIPSFAKISDPPTIWATYLFCILSSQCRTEVAQLATSRLLALVPFFEDRPSSEQVARDAGDILRTIAGYRFHASRARQIGSSWFAFAQIAHEIAEYLDYFDTEQEARSALVRTFSGIGLKQASMLLRDTGRARNLAIIDSHMIWYLKECGAVVAPNLTPARYRAAESILARKASAFGLDLCAFDAIVWSAVRALKGQFAHA